MRRFWLLLLLCLPAWPQTPWYIVPGESLGPLRIAMAYEEARGHATAAFPQVHDFTGKRIIMRDPQTGAEVVVEFDAGGLVDEIATTWESPRTGLGLHVGSTRAEVTKELGQPSRVFGERPIAYYDQLGMAFHYSDTLHVDRIYVLRPGATVHWDR